MLWLRRATSRLLVAVARPLADLTRAERLVLLGVAVLHVVGIGWGLPASDAWDVDGIAPRDFLPGVIATFTPGDYFTYPPLHLALLSLLTLPVTLVQLTKVPSFAPADVVPVFLAVPVMTAFALTARVVSVVMSLGIVLAVGRMARAVAGPRARIWAMALAGVEVAGAYYAHTSNLDTPALFWASWALVLLVEAVRRDDARALRKVAVLAACAIATKDQAYALFALTMPVTLLLWLAARAPDRRVDLVREAALCAAIVVGLVLVVDGALFNPTGFAARLRFLTGHASQDYAMYARDWAGRAAALEAAVLFLDRHYPVALAPVFVLGMIVAVARPHVDERASLARARIAAAVPLLGIVSFTLAFNCVARRVEERFMMPQMQLVAVYGGVAFAAALDAAERRGPRAAAWMLRLGAFACVASGARLTAAMLATMLGDARYEAESWLAVNVRPEDVIEVYGSNVYFPRFPPGAKVERIGHDATKRRNPMPGVVEKQDRLSAIGERRPRWVVVSSGYAWRFLQTGPAKDTGQVLPGAQAALLGDEDATQHFHALFAQANGYRLAHRATYTGYPPLLPPRALHASLACDIFVFERR